MDVVTIKVKRAIAVPDDTGKSKVDLKPGYHNVNVSILDHWFVRGLMMAGDVSIVDPNQPREYKTNERYERMVLKSPETPHSMQEVKIQEVFPKPVEVSTTLPPKKDETSGEIKKTGVSEAGKGVKDVKVRESSKKPAKWVKSSSFEIIK